MGMGVVVGVGVGDGGYKWSMSVGRSFSGNIDDQ